MDGNSHENPLVIPLAFGFWLSINQSINQSTNQPTNPFF
jgi:hypothetical protein